MKTCKILSLMVFLIAVATSSVKGQNSFDLKDKRRIFLVFKSSDSISPRPLAVIRKQGEIMALFQTESRITNDSVFISIKGNQNMCKLLESYGDTIMATLLIETFVPFSFEMSFKNGEIGFKKSWLESMAKDEKAILLIPEKLLCIDKVRLYFHWLKKS